MVTLAPCAHDLRFGVFWVVLVVGAVSLTFCLLEKEV